MKIIEEKKPVKSRDLSRQIVLFSYFTERAAEAGLVGKSKATDKNFVKNDIVFLIVYIV
jgi:hypothetical protein